MQSNMSSLNGSQFCYSRYDIKDTFFFEQTNQECLQFLQQQNNQYRLSEQVKSFLFEIDVVYKINFVLLITKELHLVNTLVNSDGVCKKDKKMGILYPKPIRTINKTTLLYLLEISQTSNRQILEKVLVSTLPLLSNIVIQSMYPLSNQILTDQMAFLDELYNWEDQLFKLKKYLPQITFILKSETQQQYNLRNKNADTQILQDYFSFCEQNQANNLIAQYFPRTDLIIVSQNPTPKDPEINYLRMKIMRYQTKPPLFFNFNNKATINYITYILASMNITTIDFKSVSKAVSEQTIKFKPVNQKPQEQTTYNVWAQEIDNFFLQKIPGNIKQQLLRCLSDFDRSVQAQLQIVKERRVADKASLICQEEKRLQSFLNEPLMMEICLACGFDYSQIKSYIDQKVVELEKREEELEISNLNLDSFYSENK